MTPRDRATSIVQTLQRKGYAAYFVGGSVRDLLLGGEPKDYDIVTSALPDEIAALFPHHIDIGKQFGVVAIPADEGLFEVATFRSEAGYSDRRRPDQVQWSDAKTDVVRRDFTVNGLLYDPVTNEVVDYVDGQRDLALKLIRTIGDPNQRFHEDPLRLLRAVRLKNQLGFQYDKPTFDAIRSLAPELAHIAAERVRAELNGCLGGHWRVAALQDLDELGLLAVVLPELSALKGTPQPVQYHKEGDVWDHTLRAIGTLPAEVPLFLVWGVIFHDSGKPKTLQYDTADGSVRISTPDHARVSSEVAEVVLRRLRFPKTEIDTISWLIRHHMSLARIEQMRPARREAYVLDPRFPWLLELHKADAAGTVPTDLSLYAHNVKLYERMKHAHRTAKDTPPLLVTGHDLQAELGLGPGRKIGELLELIRDAQLAGQLSSREEALAYARRQL